MSKERRTAIRDERKKDNSEPPLTPDARIQFIAEQLPQKAFLKEACNVSEVGHILFIPGDLFRPEAYPVLIDAMEKGRRVFPIPVTQKDMQEGVRR